MPLEKSASKKATKRNFDEFRHGKTFRRTAAKYGKETARKQMIAAVLSNQRKYVKKGAGKRPARKNAATAARRRAQKRYRKG